MLHVKLKGMEYRAQCKHIFCPYTHPRTLRWGQRSKHFFFQKIVMLRINLKEIEQTAPCKHLFCPHAHPQPLGRVIKGKKSKCGHVAY